MKHRDCAPAALGVIAKGSNRYKSLIAGIDIPNIDGVNRHGAPGASSSGGRLDSAANRVLQNQKFAVQYFLALAMTPESRQALP